MILLRDPPAASWPDQLDEHEAEIVRFDDHHLDESAMRERREQLDRLAVPAMATDDQAISGGSTALALLMLAAGIATICALGGLAYVLIRS